MRDHRADAAATGRFAVCPGIIAIVAESGARCDVGADVNKHLEIAAVAGLATGQLEGDRQAAEVGFEVVLGREAAARAAERLTVRPAFAPVAETWARTTVESNIWTRWAVPPKPASASKRASNTPDRLNRQKRFHTLFQLPNSAGSARHVMRGGASEGVRLLPQDHGVAGSAEGLPAPGLPPRRQMNGRVGPLLRGGDALPRRACLPGLRAAILARRGNGHA